MIRVPFVSFFVIVCHFYCICRSVTLYFFCIFELFKGWITPWKFAVKFLRRNHWLRLSITHGKDHYNCLGTFGDLLRLVFCSSRDHPRSFRLVGDQNQSYGWPFFRGGQEWQAWGNFRCSAWRRFSLHDRHFQMATDRMTGIVPLDRAFNLVFLPHLIFKNWPMRTSAMFQNVQTLGEELLYSRFLLKFPYLALRLHFYKFSGMNID